MNEKEIESMNFPKEWLEGTQHHGETRQNLLCLADYDLDKTWYGVGKTKALDSYLMMVWGAWDTMNGLVQCFDQLFLSENKDEDLKKLMANLFHHIELPLIDSTSEINYDLDPNDECDGLIDGFGYGLSRELKPIFVY